MIKSILKITITLIFLIFMFGCATTQQQLLETGTSQVKLRSIQTRVFDTNDKKKMLRTIIATFQDLGFVIDKADYDLGTVSATKLNRYALRMTVTVRPRGKKQLLVRANAQFEDTPVYDPVPYQNFFTSLGKALFLEAQHIE
jgi:starvation-inducible outer membrane lipoprotein